MNNIEMLKGIFAGIVLAIAVTAALVGFIQLVQWMIER